MQDYEVTAEISQTVIAVEASMAGPAGSDGAGVSAGGSSGQVLAKASISDHDTEWADAVSSLVPGSNIAVDDSTPSAPIISTDFAEDGIELPADNYTIANPPLRFVYPDMTDNDSSKGAIIEWGGIMDGTSHPYGIATYTYQQNPAATFTAPLGYKKWAWVTAHYDSPLVTGEDVHQHLNLETVKADWLTAVTRFQISFGEDVALVSFPNSHVKVYPDKNFQIGSDASGVYIRHDTALARIIFGGNTPYNFSGVGGIRVGSTGAPGGRVHAERDDDGIMFYAKNTAAGGTATAQHLIEAVTSGSTAIAAKVTGESVNRFSMNHSGRMEWGSGAATRDVNLYRNAADQLKTDDTLAVAGGHIDAVTTKTGAYTLTATDYICLTNTTSSAFSITLPTALGRTGQTYIIKDWKGTAVTNNVTIATTSSQTIDGASTRVLTAAFQSVTVISDGANWSII